jgi:hypothetical protein
MAVLIICTPISGGHLNPAITVGVWLTCDNKKGKAGKMFLMVLAQILGGFLGIAIGRMVRKELVAYSTTTPLVPDSYYPPYHYAVSPVQWPTVVPAGTGVAPEILFSEMFGSFFFVLVFLSLKYRTHLQDKSRDPVFHAAAMAATLFGITFITYDLTGLNFYNPVIAMN